MIDAQTTFTYAPYLVGALALVVALQLVLKKGSSVPKPPAPIETRNLPVVQPWKTYYDWYKEYGPILSLSLPGVPPRKVVLISGIDAITTLYTKRSALYCTRPIWQMAHLTGRQNNVAFTPYSERLKLSRRFLINAIGTKNSTNWRTLLEDEVTILTDQLIRTPEAERTSRVSEIIHKHISNVVTMLTYGHRASAEYITESEAINLDTGKCLIPGRWAIEGLPFLKYLPSILPGMDFKRWAKHAKKRFENLIGTEFDDVKKLMIAGTAVPCFVTDAFAASDLNREEESVLKSTAGSLYSAATDTTTSIIHSALHILSLYPEVQNEMYKHLSSYRQPPVAADEADLPYMKAFLRELHRFRPVVNLVSHAPIKDDVFNGYQVEKGVWVMGNIWSIVHDPAIYAEPNEFRPERHLDPATGDIDPNVLDPRTATFGYGRRRCPGEHFANAHTFLMLARLVWMFEILPTDTPKSSGEIEKRMVYKSTFISGPEKSNFGVMLRLRKNPVIEAIASQSSI